MRAAVLLAATIVAISAALVAPAAGATRVAVLNHLDVPAQVDGCGLADPGPLASGAVRAFALRRDRCRLRIRAAGTRVVVRCGTARCWSRAGAGHRPGVTWNAWAREDRGFLTLAADRPLGPRACGPAGRPPLPVGWAMREWMTCTFAAAPETRLVDAAIPGAHDAGAYDMTLERVRTCRSGTAQTIAGLIDSGAWTQEDSRVWSETQTADLRAQLDAGTRYFDLRVDWQQSGADGAPAGRYRFCHNANWAADLDATVAEIARWSDAHPREVLLLDVRYLGTLAAQDPALRTLQLERLRSALAPVCAHAVGPGVAPADLTFGGLWAAGQRFVVAFDAGADDRGAFAADPVLAACLRPKPQTIDEHWPWEAMRDGVPGCDGDYATRSADAVRALTDWALQPGHGLDPATVGQRPMLQQNQTHFTPSDATFLSAGQPGCSSSLRTWQRRVTATMAARDDDRGCLSGVWPVVAWERAGGRPNIVETDFLDDARDPLGRPDPYLFTGTLAALSWARLHATTPWQARWGMWAYPQRPRGPGCAELYG